MQCTERSWKVSCRNLTTSGKLGKQLILILIHVHDGYAWVGLRLNLGHQPICQLNQLNPVRNKNNPSRQRRRAKRKAEIAKKAATEAEEITTVEVGEKCGDYFQTRTATVTNTDISEEVAATDGDEGFEQYSTEITNTGLHVNEKTNDISDNALNENITVDDFKNLLATLSNTDTERRSKERAEERKKDLEQLEDLLKQNLGHSNTYYKVG